MDATTTAATLLPTPFSCSQCGKLCSLIGRDDLNICEADVCYQVRLEQDTNDFSALFGEEDISLDSQQLSNHDSAAHPETDNSTHASSKKQSKKAVQKCGTNPQSKNNIVERSGMKHAAMSKAVSATAFGGRTWTEESARAREHRIKGMTAIEKEQERVRRNRDPMISGVENALEGDEDYEDMLRIRRETSATSSGSPIESEKEEAVYAYQGDNEEEDE